MTFQCPDVVLDNVRTSSTPETQSPDLVPNTMVESRYACGDCGQSFQHQGALITHVHNTKHTPHSCAECRERFMLSYDLATHSRDTGHAAYKCSFAECDATFSRPDVMKRHQLTHKEDITKYSCPHCKKWRAPNGFSRKDHLTQHLRNFHHFELDETKNYAFFSCDDPQEAGFFLYCPHQDCPLFRDPKDGEERWKVSDEHLFKSRSAYTTHLRKDHDDSVFPCTVPGCNRIGGKGYFRKRDLMKHIAKAHPDAGNQAAGLEGFDMEMGDA